VRGRRRLILGLVWLCAMGTACRSSGAAGEAAAVESKKKAAPAAGAESVEGFGAKTRGGTGGRVITISEPTTEAVRNAFAEARAGNAIIRFDVREPIRLTKMIPHITGPGITIEGNGATIDGTDLKEEVALIDVRTHDVIVRDLRLRNGYDNLRVQGAEAHDVVISHVSSTGARDDGIAIGYGAHDVTVQWCLLAGNTRGFFAKYEGTRNLSLHHTWIQKSWARSPLVSGTGMVDVRNVIVEDWALWGARFENGATGNVVSSLFILSPHAVSIGGKPNAALRLKKAGDVFASGNEFRGKARSAQGSVGRELDAPPVKTLAVEEMEPLVRARAGCRPRDSIDGAYVALTQGWRVSKIEPFRIGQR
jgi:pectate lyase